MNINTCSKNSCHCRFRRRSALTLIEVMIATTITLLMMLALAQGFKTLSQTISEGRSMLTLSDQLRGLSALLRSDLEGCTTTSDTPQSVLAAAGYFKYYDGPISDATATLFNHLPAPTTVENRLSASRWGDIDDILMCTVKAKPGQVFRGKVPWALLIIDRMNDATASGTNWNPSAQIPDWNVPNADGDIGWIKAWKTDVTISSEYAEIVWFMLPLNELNTIDPSNPDYAVIDVAPGVDLNNDGILDIGDGMPDRIALCRRVLLIRPDLNISAPSALFTSGAVTAGDYLSMQPLVPSTGTPNTFRFMMQYPYQRCDLSVRPYTITDAAGTFLTSKCNSIEDLQLPENRFAHYGFPIGNNGTTLPQLALSGEWVVPPSPYLLLTNPAFENIGLTINASLRDRGFLPSCFMRTKPVALAAGGYSIVPLLEEIVASNVVGFDLKGYDTSVKQLGHPGADGTWGNDGSLAQSGWAGTDDQSITPSDPGYALQLNLINSYYPTSPNIHERQSGSGAYVDAGWGSKVVNSTHRQLGGPDIRLSTASNLAGVSKYFASSLSLLDLNTDIDGNGNARGLVPASSLYNSGRYVDPSYHQSYQPAFDTFTNAYEFDGEALIRAVPGLVWQGGLRRFDFVVPQGLADPGSDGIGDDVTDRDAIPQIPYKLPSIQVTIRVQDGRAGSLQQISVVHDLTN